MGFVRSTFIGAIGLLVFCGPVSASSPGDYAACGNSFSESVVKPDGKIVVAGRENCLIQLKHDGTVDAGFSDGGVRLFAGDPGTTVELLPAGDGSVLVTDQSLIKVRADGSNDDSFGTGGVVSLPASASAAALQSDGRILVAGGASWSEIAVARFNADGTPDGTFGEDGVINPAVPGGKTFIGLNGIAEDGSGRILVAGDNARNPAAMRFLSDGIPDNSFGPDGNGFAAPAAVPFVFGFSTHELFLDADGKYRIFGVTSADLYSSRDVGVGFDADGSFITDSVKTVGYNGNSVLAEVPNGNVAHFDGPGRLEDPFFNVNSNDFNAGPRPPRTNGIEYSPTDDSVIATGIASGYGCSPVCGDTTRLVVAKLDAGTIRPDQSFGTGGAVLVPGTECAYGEGKPSPDQPKGPWKRCRLRPPELEMSVKVQRARTRKPALKAAVTLRDPQPKPGHLKSRVELKLPSRLGYRARKVKTKVFARADQPGTITARWERRTIVASFAPETSEYEPSSRVPPNGPVRITLGLREGALKPIARKVRPERLHFRFKGMFIPNGFGESDFPRFYAPNGTFEVLRVRPVQRVSG